MKSVFGFLIAASLAIPTMTASAITIDGTAEAAYGSAIVTQQLGTTALDSTNGLVAQSSGSELDAAYGFVSNGVLYLVLAGNIDSGGDGAPAVQYDKLSVFFMTGPNGENVLTNGNYGGADFGNLNNMSGLKFDPGFAPNYWMSFPVGGTGTNPTCYVNWAQLRSGTNAGLGVYCGAISPPNYLALTNSTVPGASVSSPLVAAINNSNTAGVKGDPAGCDTNGTPSVAASVRTGIELAIPVAVIGVTTGNVSICAFLTSDPYTNMYNQVLGPVAPTNQPFQPKITSIAISNQDIVVSWTTAVGPMYQLQRALTLTTDTVWSAAGSPINGTGGIISGTDPNAATNKPGAFYRVDEINTVYCQPSLGQSSNVNFGAFPPGKHYFTIVTPPCTFGINPVSANFDPNGGTASFSIIVAGLCDWSLTSSVPWLTITSATNGAGPATVNYSVETNATTIGRQGIITLLNPPNPPLDFALNQFGLPIGPIPVDGTAEAAYGSGIVTQQIVTGFGDNADASLNTANGSELDVVYGMVTNNILYLVLAGDLESNFNQLEIFLDTGFGGQHTLTNINPDVDFNGLNRMGAGCGTCGDTNLMNNPGLTFDAGFNANYWLAVNCGGAPFALFANYAELWPGGGGTNGYFLGQTAATTNGTLFGGTNPFGIQATVNNSNLLGVPGGTGTGDPPCWDFADPILWQQGDVTTGVEIAIPLAAIGNPAGAIKVCTFINGGGHSFVSNQSLSSIWDGTDTDCEPNQGEPTVVDFSALPGAPHYFTVNP